MQFGQTPGLIDGKLPVFLFPTSLTFYSSDQSTHKQVLTLYNPYDFVLKFKVLCTAPKKYNVIDSEGSIKPRCCIDIVIRHKDICINNEGIQDKFRFNVSEFGQKQTIGYKDVPAMLLPKPEKSSSLDDTFESLNISAKDSQAQQAQVVGRNFASGVAPPSPGGPSWIVILSAIFCIVALCMPTTGETSSLPSYLVLSLHQKLIAAYILGLITMALLRS